jgi:hypothetical protein
LHEIFERLAAPCEPPSAVDRDPPMVRDQGISEARITGRAKRLEAGADISGFNRDRDWIPDRPWPKRPNQVGAARSK